VVEPKHGARSQLTEAILRHAAADRYDVSSAGIEPVSSLDGVAEVLAEGGIGAFVPAQRRLTNSLHPSPDLLLIVCEEGCGSCPYVPGARRVVRWPQPDPEAVGPEDRRVTLRQIRDDVLERAHSLPGLLPV
jgi:protein-tyrosine-phosphatase